MFDICVNIDSERFASDRNEVLERAFQNNITHMALTGSNLTSSRNILNFVEQDPSRLCSTAGIHPHDASSFNEETWNSLKQLANHDLVKAIGECGLDFNRRFSPSPKQEECFRAHIQLAEELNKPLFLHQRDAFKDFIRILDSLTPSIPVVVHCFTDGPMELQQFLERGYYIGITGWICDDRRNSQLLQAIPFLPLERVMVETDAPWLTPRHLKKIRRNEPAYLIHVVERLAKEMQVDVTDLIAHSTKNAIDFFGLN